MPSPLLPVESIQERDIDLLLLEELSVDTSFVEWLISELGLPPLSDFKAAWKSISDFGLGETDILFSYTSQNKDIYVLLENKLDAVFQYDQAKRYKERANKYLEKGDCDKAFVALVAPELYCENQSEFELFLTYESIMSKLQKNETGRAKFKAQLLKIAIEKLRRGYQPVNCEPVQQFWHTYWAHIQEKHPSLIMKKPGIVPMGSDWPKLFDDDFKNVAFLHKLAQGNVDLTFNGLSKLAALKIEQNKPEWAQFIRHGKSFSLRIFSGKVDRMKEFTTQITLVENGLKNMVKLQKWVKENKNWLQEWC